MNRTSIPWADFTWNPTTGCTFGCEWCYARKVAARFGSGFPEYDAEDECRAKPSEVFPYGFMPTVYEHRLDEPLRRKKPAVIFLGSMGDVFDPAIPDEFRDRIFATVAAAPQHTFVVLTKRAEAMRAYLTRGLVANLALCEEFARNPYIHWPLPNLILGVSVTNQADSDERIPLLLDTPAARRMASIEPMLGPVDVSEYVGIAWKPDGRDKWSRRLDFVAVGGKTPGAPLHHPNHCPTFDEDGEHIHPELVALRSLRDQCLAAGVPFHYKHGSTNPPLDGVTYDAEVPR